MPEGQREENPQTVTGFAPGAVLRLAFFRSEILGYYVGQNGSGVYVKDHGPDGQEVVKFRPFGTSTIEEVHGLFGSGGLIEEKLRQGKFGHEHLLKLLGTSDPKMTARLLIAAGDQLDKSERADRDAALVALNRLGTEFGQFLRTSQVKWLVQKAIDSTGDAKLLAELASDTFSSSVPFRTQRLARRRLRDVCAKK